MFSLRRFAQILALTTLLAPASNGLLRAGEIDFVEDFALAKDRTVPLRQLIPGTENCYYYHCLYYQSLEQFEKSAELLKLWVERHGYTPRAIEIENRQALLQYGQKPEVATGLITRRLNLQFNHQREILGAKPNLPTSLNQDLIARKTLAARALANYSNLQGFNDPALDWLTQTTLDPDRRRELISRLQRPDHAGLVKLIVDDLKYQNSGGFGSLGIHRQLLRTQLDELLALMPGLIQQTPFVETYIARLQPGPDLDWRNDPAAYVEYLDRLQVFVAKLPPSFNSLKAHVHYHRLAFDRTQGIYDKERFLEYIKLPRNVAYIQPKLMELEESRRSPADVNANFSFTLLPPIGNDEPLVRAYLHHYFLTETTYKPYEAYINDIFLKENFAEAKIVSGLGSSEQWYSLLPPEKYQALKERVDIDFVPTNKTYFTADEKVSLDLFVKNVPALLVKVYEINAANYYKQNGREVDTDVNLDGLVANEEKTHSYTEAPLRRVGRHFEFPALTKPGTYVIDFIGNGRSSRALVRKGRLQYLVKNTSAGQRFTVLDESNKKLANASVWLAGHEYTGDKNGAILVPYSTSPGRAPVVLLHEGLATLEFVQHEAENYELKAGIYVDREALLARKKAKVVIRPQLYVSGTPISLTVLEEPRLIVLAEDLDGVRSAKEVPDFKLLEDREAEFEFQVPPRLHAVQFVLRAKIQSLSLNKKIDVEVGEPFVLNEIDRSDKTADLHFAKIGGSYVVDYFGKTGEVLADRPVQLSLVHPDYRDPVQLVLQTNEVGRIVLGPLAEISVVSATSPEGVTHSWPLPRDRHSGYASVNGKVGDVLFIAYTGKYTKPDRAAFSLLEVRGGAYVADHFESLSVANGFITLTKLPAGDYDLFLKETRETVKVSVGSGVTSEGYVLGPYRKLEVRNPQPLQIASVEPAAGTVKIQLANAGKFARVHVFATRFDPEYSAFDRFSEVRDPEPYRLAVPRKLSVYLEGRNIGDEYRYILDRRLAVKFPGNMLERPSLLLNPWAIRKTETLNQEVQGGDAFGAVGADKQSLSLRSTQEQTVHEQADHFANLNFLAEGATVFLNLVPDEQGVIELKTADLAGKQYLKIMAIDPLTTASRQLALPEASNKFTDLRLLAGLDPKAHFTQQKRISVLAKGDKLVIDDIATAKFEAYDSVSKLFGYYSTLTRDPKLAEFNFLPTWPTLKLEEKRTLYSKYACHELSFFLAQRDPEFFQAVVKPYVANKRDKTFLDRWLVEDNLAPYLRPWSYEQLNTAERVFLGSRVPGEEPFTLRNLKDQVDLLPPDVERFQLLFNTALRAGALETSDELGLKMASHAQNLELSKTGGGALSLTGGVGGINLGAAVNGAPAVDAPANQPAAPPAPSPAEPLVESKPAAEESRLEPKKAEEMKKELELVDKLSSETAGAKAPASGKYRERNYDEKKSGVRGVKDAAAGKAGDRDDALYFEADGEVTAGVKRKSVRRLYQKLDQTQEFAENNYYHLLNEQMNAGLITPNKFWLDLAAYHAAAKGAEPRAFRSQNVAEASRNFTECLLALALVDLPFTAGKHETKFDGAKMTLTAASPLVAFHEEIRSATPGPAGATPILVSQNFYRASDRYRMENGEQTDKFVTEEFLTQVVYGCQVVVTNPTSARQKVEVLLQIPLGAIQVLNGQQTKSVPLDLQPYHTQTVEYAFYFPAPGTFAHYPVHVAKNEKLLAFAAPFTFKVVREPSKVDKQSWDYVSQNGTPEEVLAYLEANNLHQTNLDRIAFRMRDKAFWATALDLLGKRHVYNHTLWSYGVLHNAPVDVREFLQHAPEFLAQCGAYLDSPLLVIDPVARKAYEQLDYSPLVNARQHSLGQKRQILNDRFFAQYHRLMNILSYRRQLDSDDMLSVTYYLLLQDRTEEALGFFGRVNDKELKTRLQYDYFTAYLDLYTDDHKQARGLVEKYANYPVDRWRNLFRVVAAQLDEIEGKPNQLVDAENRGQSVTNLSSTEPNFDFKVEARKVVLNYQNLAEVQVNYYLMDVELLFSRNPFVQEFSGEFSFIRPNGTQLVKLPKDQQKLEFALPEQLHNSNVLVEIIGAGETRSQAYYANSLAVQTIENYGQLKVTSLKDNRPIAKAYVKVYAQLQNGQMKFYKDGYTDLRGRFDYTALSTNELDFVQKFSLLVLSDEHGAVVKEALPPKR